MKNRMFAALFMAVLMFGLFMTGCGGKEKPFGATDTEQTDGAEKEADDPEKQIDGTKEQTAGSGESSGLPGLGTFEAKTLDGRSFTQEDIGKKDATLLNFWATYCGPCREEMPDIAKLEKELPDNVQIVTVCLDAGMDTDLAEGILEEAGYEGVTLVSGDGGLGQIAGEIMYIPTTIVVDKDGTVVGDAMIGGQENLEEVFVEALNQALKSMGKTEIDYGEE